MTITRAHLSRGGLKRWSSASSLNAAHRPHNGKLTCKLCGQTKPESDYYTNTRSGRPQQPCRACKLARDKENYAHGNRKNHYAAREKEPEAHNPQYAPPGWKVVSCPYPGCEWRGAVTGLNEHRKEHRK